MEAPVHPSVKYPSIFATCVSFLLIALFTYTAVSKLLYFDTFYRQLSQSPLLASYAEILAWGVPLLELLLSLGLLWPKYRKVALYSSGFLLSLFSFYILAILFWSDDIPCACGGVIESLGWSGHLYMNLLLIALAIAGARLNDHEK